MPEVSWRLYFPVKEATCTFEMKQIAWPRDLIIELQVDRHDDIQRTLHVYSDQKEGITYEHILTELYKFYNESELDEDDIDEVRQTMEEGYDIFDYKKDALKEGHFNWIDLMGDCVFFQGIDVNSQNNTGVLSLHS